MIKVWPRKRTSWFCPKVTFTHSALRRSPRVNPMYETIPSSDDCNSRSRTYPWKGEAVHLVSPVSLVATTLVVVVTTRIATVATVIAMAHPTLTAQIHLTTLVRPNSIPTETSVKPPATSLVTVHASFLSWSETRTRRQRTCTNRHASSSERRRNRKSHTLPSETRAGLRR